MQQTNQFTQGPILKPLLTFTIPVLLALFLQSMYGAVDLMVVGHFGQAADVSAVSTGSQILHTLTSIITGLSMGSTILLGQKLGQRRLEDAGKVLGCTIAVFAAFSLIVTVVMLAISEPFATVMQAPPEAYEQTVAYVRICSAGSVFIVAYNVLGAAFRGIGDSRTPLLTVTIACIVNIIGDFLLVGGFHMGVAGAAIATVLAQAVSVLLSLLFTAKKGLPFPFQRSYIRFDTAYTQRILTLGAPIALQDALVSVSFLAIIAITNGLGVVSSAGVGVAEKLVGFIMLVPSSYMQSLSAFVAQNIGAGYKDRAKKAMFYGMGTSLCFGVVLFYLSFFHGDILASIFAKDTQVIAAAVDYLKAYAIDTLFTSIMFCFAGYFNGCGNTTFVMIQGVAAAFLVRIPIAFFMSRIEPVSLFRVGLATPISTVFQILLFVGYYFYLARRQPKSV